MAFRGVKGSPWRSQKGQDLRSAVPVPFLRFLIGERTEGTYRSLSNSLRQRQQDTQECRLTPRSKVLTKTATLLFNERSLTNLEKTYFNDRSSAGSFPRSLRCRTT